MENKLSNIFNKAKKIAGVAVKTAQNLASPVTAFSNAAEFSWNNKKKIGNKVINNPIIKEITAGTQAFGRGLGNAIAAPIVMKERERIQKLNIQGQNKALELAKIAKDNGNMQEYNRLMGLYKNDNRVSEFAKETAKLGEDWQKQKSNLPKEAALTAIEGAAASKFLAGGAGGLAKNTARSTLFAGGLDAIGQGIDIATGRQKGYDLGKAGESVIRGIGNAPLFSLASGATDKALLGFGKTKPLKGILGLTDSALKKSGAAAVKGNWKDVALYLAKNMTREGLLESFPETAAFYLKDQAKGDNRDVFTYFAQELPTNAISGALFTGLGMGGMNVIGGKYMPKMKSKLADILDKNKTPEEFTRNKKITYKSDPNQLTMGIDPSKMKIENVFDDKNLPKNAIEGDKEFFNKIESDLVNATTNAGDKGNIDTTKRLLENIKKNYKNANLEQKANIYAALNEALSVAKAENGKFYFANFIDRANKIAGSEINLNPYAKLEKERVDSLALKDPEGVRIDKQPIKQSEVAVTKETTPNQQNGGLMPIKQEIPADKTNYEEAALQYITKRQDSLTRNEILGAKNSLYDSNPNKKLDISTLEFASALRAGKTTVSEIENFVKNYRNITNLNKKNSTDNTMELVNEILDGKHEDKRLSSSKLIEKYIGNKNVSPNDTIEIFRADAKNKPITSGQYVTISEESATRYVDERPGAVLHKKVVKLQDLLKTGARKQEFTYLPTQSLENQTKQQAKISDEKQGINIGQTPESGFKTQELSDKENKFFSLKKQVDSLLPKITDESDWWERFESGDRPEGSDKIEELLKNTKDTLNKDFGFDIGEKENYLPHMKPETIENIIKYGGQIDSYGKILSEPTFALKRTGSLKDYEKSSRVIAAYLLQAKAYAQATPEQKAQIITANKLKSEYSNKEKALFDKQAEKLTLAQKAKKTLGNLFDQSGKYIKSQKTLVDDVDFVKITQEGTAKDYVYDKNGDVVGQASTIKKDLKFDTKNRGSTSRLFSSWLRSSLDMADAMGDDFYNTFAKRFENDERAFSKLANSLPTMSREQLIDFALKNTNLKNFDNYSDEDLKIDVFTHVWKKTKEKSINEFRKNVERTDFGDNQHQKNVVNRLAAEYIGDDLRSETFFDELSTAIRKSAGRATLAFNVLSGINNTLEQKRVWSLTSTKAVSSALKEVAKGESYTKKYGVNSLQASALVTQNKGKNIFKGSQSKIVDNRSKIAKTLDKLDPYFYKIFQVTEDFKDNVFLGAFEYQGKEKGLKGDDLSEFVIRKFNRYAVKYGKGNDTGLYRSSLVKTLFQFGQYPIKDAVILYDKTKGALKGDKGDTAYALKYAFSSLVTYIVARKLLGIGSKDDSDTPIDLINSTSKGQLPYSPIVNFMGLLSYWGARKILGHELSEYEEHTKKSKMINAALSTFIPAGAQGKKTIEGILQQARGYDNKSHGRSVANVTGDGALNAARAMVFGKSYDSGRKKYLENLRELDKVGKTAQAGLTEKESAAFHSVRNTKGIDQAKAFYNDTVATKNEKIGKAEELNKIINGKKGAKTDILGQEKKKKGFISSLKDILPFKKEQPAGSYLDNVENINDIDVVTVKHIRNQVTKKEDLGKEISNKEYEIRYLYDYNSLDEDTNSQKIKKELEAYKIAKSLDDNDYISNEQKAHLLSKLNINDNELVYNKMAGEYDDVQSEYIRENLQALNTKEEMLEFLINNRAKVGGKQVLTDTIISSLVKEGLLDKTTGNKLKKLSFVKDNDYEGDDYIMIGNAKYKPVIKQDSSNGGGSSSRTSRSDKYKAQAWGSIKNMLAKQKSINNQGINNKAVTNQYTRKNLGNILNRVSPENENTKLLSQILQETKQRRQGSKSKNNTLF